MPRGLFQKISGEQGSVTIPTLGVQVGTMSQWRLTLRPAADGSDDSDGLYDLRAVFNQFQPYLWEDEDYEKLIVVVLGRGKQRLQFRVQKASGEATVLTGRTLLMKGVSIHVHGEERHRGQ